MKLLRIRDTISRRTPIIHHLARIYIQLRKNHTHEVQPGTKRICRYLSLCLMKVSSANSPPLRSALPPQGVDENSDG